MYKITHICYDSKFLYEILNFDEKIFINQLVFFGDISSVNDNYQDLIYDPKDDSDIIKLCNNSDVVIFYGKFESNVDILENINSDKIILWRFFGFEIYNKEIAKVLSKDSFQLLYNTFGEKFVYIKQIIYNTFNKYFFNKSICLFDGFLGVMDLEYEYLKDMGYNLPEFIQVPYLIEDEEIVRFEKNKSIILGNSRNIFNNHADILLLLKSIDVPNDINIKIFFSYGVEGTYSNYIETLANKIPCVQVEREFLSKNDFNSVYKNASALIINSYRQMAMGNVYKAIECGVKVYLSEKNITYHWFKERKIKVFSVEKNLRDDLLNDNLKLSKSDMIENLTNIRAFFNADCFNDLNFKILNLILKKKRKLS